MSSAGRQSTDPRSPPAIDAAIAPGIVLGGRYRVVRRIGSGGMGSVWRVHDERAAEDVALKVLPPRANAGALARFRREVTLARRIAHPSVCRVFDLGDPDGLHVLIMELIEGESLRARLARGPLSWPEAHRLIDDLLAGLAAIHAAGIVHRDIKPENIVLSAGGRAVIVDFGLAWVPAAQASTAPDVGTPQYMAPERLSGEAGDARSDVFAAGLSIHEALDGRPPFEGATTALVAAAILRDPPRPLEGTAVPAAARDAVARMIARALGRDRMTRQADAGELRGEWLAAIAGAPCARPGLRAGMATGAALALIGAASALLALPRQSDAPAGPPIAPPALAPNGTSTGEPARVAPAETGTVELAIDSAPSGAEAMLAGSAASPRPRAPAHPERSTRSSGDGARSRDGVSGAAPDHGGMPAQDRSVNPFDDDASPQDRSVNPFRL